MNRDSNIELYRIITMLAIIAHHYVVCSGIYSGGTVFEDYSEPHALFYWVFGMWGKTGINCFVLITGYFMCLQKITLRKFLKLVLQIEFYNFTISAILLATHYEGYTIKNFIWMLVPIRTVNQNFDGCFILFWLTIPFLNVLIHHLDRKMHLRLVLLSLFIYTGMLYFHRSTVTMNYVSWFIVLFFISSYIRLYPDSVYKSNNSRIWGSFSLLAIVFAISSVILTCLYNDYFNVHVSPHWLVVDSNAIFALLVGFTSFMFFKNLRIPKIKSINVIASTTFGVLLIHSNSAPMRHWLWYEVVDSAGHYNVSYYYLYAIVTVVIIFIVCSFIDFVRIKTIEKLTFHYIDKLLDKN